MNQPKFSWRWRIAALIVGCLIGASAVAAFRQGQADNQAKLALQASIENDRRIEAARVERVKQLNLINKSQCKSLRNLYSIIRLTIAQSDRNIQQIQYYRDHPSERAAAHAQNRRTLSLFREPPCPPRVVLPNKPVAAPPPIK